MIIFLRGSVFLSLLITDFSVVVFQDFHEMSLKRHIKDVHFRDQNTYVICPQCCKQYASQNSLYSHLNRVHGVKREMMADYEIKGKSDTVSLLLVPRFFATF